MAEVFNECFRHDFTPPVWTMGFKSRGLWNGNDRWCSINGGRRRVDDPVALELVHNLKEINRGADIIGVVRQWDLG